LKKSLFALIFVGNTENEVNANGRQKKTNRTVNNIAEGHRCNSTLKIKPIVQFTYLWSIFIFKLISGKKRECRE